MARRTQWTCDGCGETAISPQDRQPDNWHQASVTWSGLESYPSNLKDGGTTADLCGRCAKHLAQTIRPTTWSRAAKADVGS